MPIVYRPDQSKVKFPKRPASWYSLGTIWMSKNGDRFIVVAGYDFQEVFYKWEYINPNVVKPLPDLTSELRTAREW